MSKDVLVVGTSYMNQKISGNNRSNFIPEFLEKNGAKVERITSNFNHHTKEYVLYPEKNLSYKATLIKTIKYKKNVSFRRIISQFIYGYNLKKYLRYREVPDAIYLFIPSLSAGNIIRKYAKKNNVKLIIDVRDLWPEAFKMVFNIPIISTILYYPFKKMSDKVYAAADEIIAVSDTYKNRALAVNNKVNKGHTIYLGTDLDTFDAAICEQNLVKNNFSKVKIAYVGTLGNSYDLETAFDAINILNKKGYNNIQLIIFGSGPLEKKFKAYVKKIKIEVLFEGRLPYAELVNKLTECDIALNPIRQGAAQSIINKHADYAAAALPVINSQENEEYRDIVKKYNIGLNSKNSDAIDMANKIEVLINNPEVRSEMAKNHRILAEKIFDRKKTYKKIIELI